MRFGTSISRIFAAIGAMFSSAPATRRSSIRARHEMQALAEPVGPAKHRNKTGGPNWLKMAINQQRHR